MRGARTRLVCVPTFLVAAPASAVPPFEVPWTDRPPRVDRARGLVRVAAAGAPGDRLGRLSAAKRSARHAALSRARMLLHARLDDALAQARGCPHEAVRARGIVDGASEVVGVRPLVDGSAVVVVEVPLGALREVAAPQGVPWVE